MRIFIYGCLTLLALTGCSKAEEDSPIPNYRVYFETPYAKTPVPIKRTPTVTACTKPIPIWATADCWFTEVSTVWRAVAT